MVCFSDTFKVHLEYEQRLLSKTLTFQECFITLNQIESFISRFPEKATQQSITSLLTTIKSTRFDRQKQRFFLFQACCRIMILMIRHAMLPLRQPLLSAMQDLLVATSGARHRAIAEALGSLPLNIKGYEFDTGTATGQTIRFDELLQTLEIESLSDMVWQGRSLVGTTKKEKIGVIKFFRRDDRIEEITKEISWMEELKHLAFDETTDFDIPVPVRCRHCRYFEITHIPRAVLTQLDHRVASGAGNSQYRLAIAFIAGPEYFTYPNEPVEDSKPMQINEASRFDFEQIRGMFKNNASLLGGLASQGIIHTALIPLFHNRAQRHRRDDGGYYLWEHGGRLDKWLESCRYPNFGASGLRDFEHLEPLEDHGRFHHYIGTHLLSFILVAGSCFRNQVPTLKGLDEKGNPADARHLFDKTVFQNLLIAAIQTYYRTLTGVFPTGLERLISLEFIDKLIQKMGMDTDMDERLRVEDQNLMDEQMFTDFISQRLCPQDLIDPPKRGRDDITFVSGPHLGGFNQPISVPELTDLLFTLSALCISDRYALENGLKPLCN
ncbi:MAG: hypothetical protein D3926_05350 [Desulfobacteraceae bacterium]|nr:MAG: hypothetical protein D3926_05350 [Desulfobacteraceae bacterium]